MCLKFNFVSILCIIFKVNVLLNFFYLHLHLFIHVVLLFGLSYSCTTHISPHFCNLLLTFWLIYWSADLLWCSFLPGSSLVRNFDLFLWIRQHFGDRKHGFIFQIMENGTKEKEELGAAYLQENFDVGGTADEVQYIYFFHLFFCLFLSYISWPTNVRHVQ